MLAVTAARSSSSKQYFTSSLITSPTAVCGPKPQVFEAEDFGAELTPELRKQEERPRAQVEKRSKAR